MKKQKYFILTRINSEFKQEWTMDLISDKNQELISKLFDIEGTLNNFKFHNNHKALCLFTIGIAPVSIGYKLYEMINQKNP